jgi:hypothetical protein
VQAPAGLQVDVRRRLGQLDVLGRDDRSERPVGKQPGARQRALEECPLGVRRVRLCSIVNSRPSRANSACSARVQASSVSSSSPSLSKTTARGIAITGASCRRSGEEHPGVDPISRRRMSGDSQPQPVLLPHDEHV